jgi:dynein heavy chain
MKNEPHFSGLESNVKNMVTSLRAVTELQNPAIRERHWLQLMQTTKVPISISHSRLAILFIPI